MSKKTILFVIGSLRKDSFNRQLAKKAEEYLGSRAEVRYLEYGDIPYMNQDIEFPVPPAILRVRKEVEAADAVWIFTAEYNYNIPGVLKNLLDWLSRPLAVGDPQRVTAVTGKPVTISGAGGKGMTASVRRHLDALLPFMKMKLMKEGETGIAVPAEAWSSNVLTLSEEQQAALKKQAEDFLSFLS